MGLRDELAAVADRGRGRCGWAGWLASLDEEDASAAVDALDDPSWTNSRLGEELVRHGAPLGAAKLVARHRRGECVSCR